MFWCIRWSVGVSEIAGKPMELTKERHFSSKSVWERERPNATTINFLKKFYSVCKRMERRYETDVENSNSNNKFGNYWCFAKLKMQFNISNASIEKLKSIQTLFLRCVCDASIPDDGCGDVLIKGHFRLILRSMSGRNGKCMLFIWKCVNVVNADIIVYCTRNSIWHGERLSGNAHK